MSFVSYAQNFEDVMLWRALGYIENGCYIDIGAQDPVIDSVSLAFYERGWRGIHVEPAPHYAYLLRESRPEDVIVQAAVGAQNGVLTFFEFPDTGLSTADCRITEKNRAAGFQMREIAVSCITLADVLSQCTERDVHWLKIDVEGFEGQVLKSWNKASTRPWIVVVESTLPLTQVESYREWEPLLLRRGYRFAYFDGLNRFYVLETHPELLDAFRVGPNLFDDFTLNGTASSPFCSSLNAKIHVLDEQLQMTQQQAARSEGEALRQQLSAAQQQTAHVAAELAASQAKVDELNHSSHRWWTVADQINRELQGVYASKSWRITWPLRQAMQVAKWVVAFPKRAVRWMLRLPKRMAKPLVVWAMRRTLANHRLKARALGMLAKHPQLKQRLREFMSPVTQSSPTSSVPLSPITNVNMTAIAPADEGSLHASLVRAMQAWPLGRRIDGR